MTGMQSGHVSVAQNRIFHELLREPVFDDLYVAPEHPLDEAKRIEIFAPSRVALAQAIRLHGFDCEPRDVHFDELIRTKLTARARIYGVARFREIALSERLAVNDDQRTVVERREVDLERRRIERDEHARCIAGGIDRPSA
jgi:hypothetical protein